jgi:DNA-directed RNA polymerase subunit RPC12/RpoP
MFLLKVVFLMSKWYEKEDENGYLNKLIIDPNEMEVGMEIRIKGTQYIVTYVKPPETKNGKVKQEIGLSRKVWNCPDCGSEIKEKNKSCPNCGSKLTYKEDKYNPYKTGLSRKIILFIGGIITFLIGLALGDTKGIFLGAISIISSLIFYYIDY